MGEELGCERISIFEENEEGTCDNTYKWCSPGVVLEQITLQNIEIAKFDRWHDRLINHETIVVRSPEELRDHDPDVYQMFMEQDIHTAIVTLLAFHGRNFGFCILEDPADEDVFDRNLTSPRGLFREHILLAAITGEWREKLFCDIDDFIHDVHEKTEKETILLHRNNKDRLGSRGLRPEDRAEVDLPRGEAFFRLADRFLADI